MTKTTRGPGIVTLELLQERFAELQARGLTAADLAFRMGWVHGSGHKNSGQGDSTRFLRALGLRSYQDSTGSHRRTHVTESVALKLGQAMGLDPHEIGL